MDPLEASPSIYTPEDRENLKNHIRNWLEEHVTRANSPSRKADMLHIYLARRIIRGLRVKNYSDEDLVTHDLFKEFYPIRYSQEHTCFFWQVLEDLSLSRDARCSQVLRSRLPGDRWDRTLSGFQVFPTWDCTAGTCDCSQTTVPAHPGRTERSIADYVPTNSKTLWNLRWKFSL